MSDEAPGRALSWLRLIRVPNLLTVPGDPLAGALLWALATGNVTDAQPAATVCLCSLLIYTAGLIDNDLADLAEDRAQRPGRPLACGAIKPRTAAGVEALCIVVALLLALSVSGILAVFVGALQASVWLYNRLAKHTWAGPWTMGMCRGLSLFAGAVAVGGHDALHEPLPLTAALGLTAYIAAVTNIARRETSAGVRPGQRWLPPLAYASTIVVVSILTRCMHPAWYGLAFLATLTIGRTAWRLDAAAAPALIQLSIGQWIGAILLIQASLCAMQRPHGLVIAGALVLVWPMHARLGKWFYSS